MNTEPMRLNKGAERRIKAGHHWVYANEVDQQASPLKGYQAGEVVNVIDHRGKALGSFMVNPNALICARLVSRRADRELSSSLIKNRLKQALALRQYCYDQPYYRWVYGDSDGLSGLVVDRFGDILSVQVSTQGMERCLETVIDHLVRLVQPKGILLKNDGKMRSVEGLESYVRVAYGEVPDEVEIIENGVSFIAPIMTGQKTGWFYDHRANRQLAASFAKDKTVLDVFSYLGGWGLTAGVNGASHVTCVDASGLALAGVQQNAERNGLADKVATLEGDAFEILQQLNEEKQRFDVVIIDPPAFITRRKDIEAGERAYQKLVEAAMKLVNYGGILVSASCSMHLETDRLRDMVRSSARKLERHAQILAEGSQGTDHPVLPAVRETRYIKAIFAAITPNL
ncbi:class I SAM-dependent rRNA methyltransferase [Reinekea thalattae]|uniref:Class I SAM-dependent rRNA methyltransferase n=1 Tax=Reinekea thalattae TaxID=2593301 RepID=A0A5C8ZAQ7_9GAMM|nr:class I SAM-dependent rRNA methyltransferase [Reinekea thalattae]TXR54847.1 class I SAM-dependent rRNA methyltransferase [Reinekea thalattae]